MIWIIEKLNGESCCRWEKNAGPRQIESVLQQLASRELTEEDIIERGHTVLKVHVRHGGIKGTMLECGNDAIYVAYRKNPSP